MTYGNGEYMAAGGEKPPVSLEFLADLISSDIRLELSGDKILLYLPWHFAKAAAEKSLPLCLTVRAEGDGAVISDGGRAIAELSKKVPSLLGYRGRISDLISDVGSYELVGGRIIEYSFYSLTKYGVLSAVSQMLKIVTAISNLDLVPYTRGEYRRLLGEYNDT